MKTITFLLLIIAVTASNSLLFSQHDHFYPFNDCGMEGEVNYTGTTESVIGGYLKPHRSDSAYGGQTPSTARFNILAVFVQFSDESAQASH